MQQKSPKKGRNPQALRQRFAEHEAMISTGCPRTAGVASAIALSILLAASQASRADGDVADQAKQSQNPIANLISVPLQNNANLNAGPERETLNILNVQPVVPISLGPDWNLIRLSHAYNNGLMQPFVNYSMSHGTYLVSSPVVTVNWTAVGGQQWTVPLGGGIGQIVHLGKLPVNMQLAGYCNVVRPTNGPSWQVRTQVQFLFPK
jgi:hypothetical protein